jgi:hypothetical protein
MNNYMGGKCMDNRFNVTFTDLNQVSEIRCISEEISTIAAEREQRMFDLKPSLSIEEIKQPVDWLEDKYTKVLSLVQQNEIMRSWFPGIENTLERDRRASQKKVINVLLQHLLDKQKKAWPNGTPEEQLNILNLSSEEKEKYQDKLRNFIDPITSNYIKYAVHMSTPSAVSVYLDIDTIFDMVEHTHAEPKGSFVHLIQDSEYHQALPKETISLRDPFGDTQTELTAKNFSPVEIDFSDKLDELIKQIQADRQALSEQSNISPGPSR